jgi:hypothetical protein
MEGSGRRVMVRHGAGEVEVSSFPPFQPDVTLIYLYILILLSCFAAVRQEFGTRTKALIPVNRTERESE